VTLLNVGRVTRLPKAAMMSMNLSVPPIPTPTAVHLKTEMMETMIATTANPCNIVEFKGSAVFLSILIHLGTCLAASPTRVLTEAIAVKHPAPVLLKYFLLWAASLPLVLGLAVWADGQQAVIPSGLLIVKIDLPSPPRRLGTLSLDLWAIFNLRP
jgi:hypothetical protein